jgi:V8-like Glu-specific endopeptidase
MLQTVLASCARWVARNLETRPGRAPARARLALESLEGRITPSLTPISSSAGYPFTSIAKLVITFPDNQVYGGSGALIDSFHVLTAGHNTYSYQDGGWAKSIQVIPEMNGSYQPFGSAYMTYERTYSSFINYNVSHPHQTSTGINDIALLTLNRNVGNQTGWMGFGYDNNNAHFAAGRIFNTAGYPAAGGYNGQQMYLSSGQIAGLSSDGKAIDYYQSQITTYGGQSGSPLWEYIPSTGSRVIYGVHVAGSGTSTSLNFATRITQSIFNDLQTWRMSDHAPTAQFVAQSAYGGTTALLGQSASTQDEAGAVAVDAGGDASPSAGPALSGFVVDTLSATHNPADLPALAPATQGPPASRHVDVALSGRFAESVQETPASGAQDGRDEAASDLVFIGFEGYLTQEALAA